MSDDNGSTERVFSRKRGDMDLSAARAQGVLPEKLLEQAARKLGTAQDQGKIEVLRRAAEALERSAAAQERLAESVDAALARILQALEQEEPRKTTSKARQKEQE